MLKISDEFFKEEVRSGFTVSETMKKAWAIQLEMIDTVLDIAQKYEIPIWADYGTLLGTVRHSGFIPWDDDIDFSMLRKDYMIFLKILQDELPECYKIFSFYNLEDYDQPKILISNRHNLDYGNSQEEAKITKSQYGFPYVTGIDIFPLDYVPSDAEQFSLIINLYSSAYDLAFNYDQYKSSGELDIYLTQLESILNTKLQRDNHLKTTLWKLSDALSMMTHEDEAEKVAYYPSCVVDGMQMTRNAQDFSHTKYLDFEMLRIPVPGEYENVLISTYGKNYMTPVHEGAWHEYPFYKAQDKQILFNNKLGQMEDVF